MVARELRQRGHAVVVQTADEHEELIGRCCDIVLHRAGLRCWIPQPGQPNLLWCISLPDDVAPTECRGYDLVAVASESLAATWQSHLDIPVLLLEQATDPDVFLLSGPGDSARPRLRRQLPGSSARSFAIFFRSIATRAIPPGRRARWADAEPRQA